MKTCIHIW